MYIAGIEEGRTDGLETQHNVRGGGFSFCDFFYVAVRTRSLITHCFVTTVHAPDCSIRLAEYSIRVSHHPAIVKMLKNTHNN